jgi:hypothetical protein
MHPFDFTATISFVCTDPDASFVFEPAYKKFHWYGKTLDKLGTYAFSQTARLQLELEWNYAREQSYTVVSFEGTGDAMASFVLQHNGNGQLYSFRR